MNTLTEAPPLLTEITARDICGLAAEYIEEHGWIQGWLENPKGNVCTVGALRRTVGLDPEGLQPDKNNLLYPTYKEARKLVAEATNTVSYIGPDGERDNVPFWNDRPERTQAEVVSVLRSVANG